MAIFTLPQRRGGVARRAMVTAGTAVAMIALAACGSDASGDDADARGSDHGIEMTPSGDAAFNQKWEELAAQAREEGKLVILDGPNVSEGEGAVYDAFGDEYGIEITHITGDSDEIVSRVLAERQQDIYSVDLTMAGGGATTRMLEAGIYSPLEPLLFSPEATDRSTGWPSTEIQWNPDDTEKKFVTSYSRRADANFVPIWYNTDNVSEDDAAAMTSWEDLLDPKYQGRIEISDVANDSASNDRTLGWLGLDGSSYWERFLDEAQPEVLPVGSSRAMADALARGDFDFALFIDADDAFVSAEEDGLPVTQFDTSFSEGWPASAGGNLGVVDQTPHPAAAQLFVNWLLSKPGQTMYNELNENSDNVAERIDVPQGNIDDDVWARATDSNSQFISLDEAFATARSDSLVWWKEAFDERNLGTHS